VRRPRFGHVPIGGVAVSVVAVVVCALLATACGASTSLRVDPPEPSDEAADSACRALVDVLPDELDGQERRDIDPPDQLSAAWGAPAIVLRCGVAEPEALEPTSACFEVSGVGWLATQDGEPADLGAVDVEGAVTFTTIGRAAYVEVSVPDTYQPAAAALAELAEPVGTAVPEISPCQ